MTPATKKCPACGETKPVDEFNRDRRKRDGRRSRCRACEAEYRNANRERDLERSRAYREANRERDLERKRAYREAARARVEVEGPRRYANREPYPRDLTEVGYNGAHKRVRIWYGPARAHPCAASGCERQAEEWAYIGPATTDLHRRIATITDGRNGTTREVSFSLDPARYAPLCRGCHVRLDRDGTDVFAEADALFSITLIA